MSDDNAQVDRVDITIESSSIVFWIEAKIRAEEDLEQLKQYYKQAQLRLQNRVFIGKFLTKDGTSGEQVVDGFRRLLWSDVARALRRFGDFNGDSRWAARNLFVARMAEQYAGFIDSHFAKG